DLDDIPRYKELGVIASMQPSHAIGDLYFANKRIGKDRLAGGYAWRSLIDSGAIIAGGSDAPVERGDPRIEFYAASARKSLDGYSGENWFPEEKITRTEALKMFTEWAAYAAFEEDVVGKIAAGMRADFTVFDKDIMVIPEAEILKVETVMTIVDGEIIYKR
ncbi:MAG: amidohydrolase family protein, partial [Robiginitomaculum sp.]|nr:amidohydrolase family protein [Robiginitomaculum sp.]